MNKKIAVVVNKNGETTTLYDKSVVKVYLKEQGHWKILSEKIFNLERGLNMPQTHAKMGELVDFLEDCKVIVASSVVGIQYFILEKAQFNIWEIEGTPNQFLDEVLKNEEEEELEQLKQQQTKQEENNVVPMPVEKGNGIYEINLKTVQGGNSGVSSKQVLLPFLRKGQFYQLEVLCSHVPRWLEDELVTGNFTSKTEDIGMNEIKIMISKKTCHD